MRGFAVAAALVAFCGSAGAQNQSDRSAEGIVQRPGLKAPVPVPGQWVVLHRVGSDRAAPLDSMRSDAAGRFRFRYALSGQPEALYFVSSIYRGIAYFSSPFHQAIVRGGNADLLVFDTTSNVQSLRLQGRHLVVSAPRGSRREIAEIFEIENDAERTVVARDTLTPLWATQFPLAAESLSVAPGDLGAGTVSFRNGRGELFAPISPGVRQLVVTYRLRVGEFPVTLPIERAVSVLEVLLEEPRAIVEGAGLIETAPAAIEGRNFRRFLAKNVPAGAAMRVRAPVAVVENQAVLKVMAMVMALMLAAGLIVWAARRRSLPQHTFATEPMAPAAPELPSELLVAKLAALDARFEKAGAANEAVRSRHELTRAALKRKIVNALAAESARS
jgi:hypothetical protein